MPRHDLTQSGLAVVAMVDALHSSPLNPRRHFGDAALDELAESVRAHGVLQPILVRTTAVDGLYEIVAGERRWRAARLAGLQAVPVIVRTLTDREAVELAVLENVQRESLTPLEEADGFAAMHRHGWTAAQIAERVGKSRGYVGNRLAIADAGEAVRAALAAGDIGPAAAAVLARVPAEARDAALAQCGKGATSREANAAANRAARPLDEAPFALGDASLCPAAGTCHDCPKRSGADRGLFGDVADFCLDGDCWRRKAGVAFVRRAATHPGPVMNADAAAEHFGEHGLRWDSPFAHKPEATEVGKLPPKAAAKVATLKVTLAQDPYTGAAVELVNKKAWNDLVSASKPVAKPAAAPKVAEAQKAAEAERKRCEAAGEALVAAAVADRRNAAVRLIGMGRAAYGDDFRPTTLAVAGATKQSALGAWARKATKDDFAAFVLADRLEGEYCGDAVQVRNLAKTLDLPVPEGFAEAPKAKAKAGKRGAK